MPWSNGKYIRKTFKPWEQGNKNLHTEEAPIEQSLTDMLGLNYEGLEKKCLSEQRLQPYTPEWTELQ